MGLKAGPLARWMLRGRRTKHWMRTIYALKSLWQLKRGLMAEEKASQASTGDHLGLIWQAGKSVATIHSIEPAGEIVRRFAAAIT
jgi:nitronate monooxygenase